MARKLTPFLMFQGDAEAAMALYLSTFPGARVVSRVRHGPQGPDPEGKVLQATLSICGQELMVLDSDTKHAFTFTPATSLFVECESEGELDRAFAALSEGGAVLMPPGNYGFSTKYAWIADRFGVSWQLNLA